MGTDVSLEPAISVFRVKEYSLKMEIAGSSETFILTDQTTGHDISEGHSLNIKLGLRDTVRN
jgi:hypothetical protein